VRTSTPRTPGFLTLVLPLESAESFTLIVLNGIARLLVTVRFLTTDEAFAGVLGAGVLGAAEGVADAVAGTIAARVVVAVGVAPDPQALITSRLLTAKVILMAGLMASSPYRNVTLPVGPSVNRV
jgi:hypothetical protein